MLGKGFLRFVGADVWGNNAKLSVRKRVLRGSFERMFGGNNAKLSVRKMVLRGSYLTFWRWKLTLKKEYIIYVKCQYFTNQKT